MFFLESTSIWAMPDDCFVWVRYPKERKSESFSNRNDSNFCGFRAQSNAVRRFSMQHTISQASLLSKHFINHLELQSSGTFFQDFHDCRCDCPHRCGLQPARRIKYQMSGGCKNLVRADKTFYRQRSRFKVRRVNRHSIIVIPGNACNLT